VCLNGFAVAVTGSAHFGAQETSGAGGLGSNGIPQFVFFVPGSLGMPLFCQKWVSGVFRIFYLYTKKEKQEKGFI
jgi:hypothetical protein